MTRGMPSGSGFVNRMIGLSASLWMLVFAILTCIPIIGCDDRHIFCRGPSRGIYHQQ